MALFAQQKQSSAPAAQPPATPAQAQQSKGCLAVKPAGTHAFRNILLGGIAGALVSKEQYKVMYVKDYPTHVGAKFRGNDLQTIQHSGTKVVVLDKHANSSDAAKACD